MVLTGTPFAQPVKRKNPDLTRHLQNVYRVLMSRAHRGVCVHFMDKETEMYFRNAMPEPADSSGTSENMSRESLP